MRLVLSIIWFIIVLVLLIILALVQKWKNYYLHIEYILTRHILLTLLFGFSIILLTLAIDIFILFIAWDLLGITSFLLITYYNNHISISGSIITILTSKIGDSFIIYSLIHVLWFNSSILLYSIIIIVLLELALCTKRALIPCITWLPLAINAPTNISSLVHSRTLVCASIIIIMKISILHISYLLELSIIRIILSSLTAIFIFDAKKRIAISTLSQIAFIVLLLSLDIFELAFIHILAHAYIKSSSFILIGTIIHSYYNNQSYFHYNTSYSWTSINLIFGINILSLAGIILLAGAIIKDIVIEIYTSILLTLILILTILYSIRIATIIWSYIYLGITRILTSIIAILPILLLHILSIRFSIISFIILFITASFFSSFILLVLFIIILLLTRFSFIYYTNIGIFIHDFILSYTSWLFIRIISIAINFDTRIIAFIRSFHYILIIVQLFILPLQNRISLILAGIIFILII